MNKAAIITHAQGLKFEYLASLFGTSNIGMLDAYYTMFTRWLNNQPESYTWDSFDACFKDYMNFQPRS